MNIKKTKLDHIRW